LRVFKSCLEKEKIIDMLRNNLASEVIVGLLSVSGDILLSWFLFLMVVGVCARMDKSESAKLMRVL
jgi:hypothetical protein